MRGSHGPFVRVTMTSLFSIYRRFCQCPKIIISDSIHIQSIIFIVVRKNQKEGETVYSLRPKIYAHLTLGGVN